MKKLFIIFTICFLLAGLFSRPVFAGDYDIYVDEDADSGGDGSSDDPFKKIEDALDEAKKGDGIYIKNGSYDGGFTVESGVKIKGQSESKVKIEGGITMEDDSRLSKVTVSGGKIAVAVVSGASVTIDGCTVEGFSKIGINIVPGNGKLVVKNSNIAHSSGKGFYVEKGNKLELSASKIYDNDEEGVDIRAKVDGFIVGNEIYDNGESGIEVILGSADLSIKNNDIENNGSSGIATQYYESTNKLGGVKIQGNEIEDNDNYGIDCKMTQAGHPVEGYWEKSLNLVGNEFEGNKLGIIAPKCKISDKTEEEEAQKVAAKVPVPTPSEEVLKQTQEAEAEIEREKEELRKKTEAAEATLVEVDTKFKAYQEQTGKLLDRMNERDKTWLWIRGTSPDDLRVLTKARDGVAQEVAKLDVLSDEFDEGELSTKIEEKRNLLEEDRKFLAERVLLERQSFSLWGFFKKLFWWQWR